MVMTVASFLATVAGLLVRWGVYTGSFGGSRRQNGNAAAAFLLVLLVSVVVYVLSFLLLRALSRHREFAADRGGAIMTGAPSQLASALAKITGSMARIPTRDLRAAEGLNAFFIVPAVARGFSLSSLFHTHPPVEKRIERLLALQAQMEGAPLAAV
jgi:heat shock protein HtpX